MDSNGTVVISDFGVAALIKSQGDRISERRTFAGTPCWMAPEVMEQSEAYDEKADIWSFGITALELAKGYAPYARLNPIAVMIQTIREDPPSLKTYETTQAMGGTGHVSGDTTTANKFSRHFKEIVTMCLQKNPKLRPSAATLLSRSLFTKAKDKSVLVRDILEAVPIPDTEDIDASKNFQPDGQNDMRVHGANAAGYKSQVTAQVGQAAPQSSPVDPSGNAQPRKRVTHFLEQDVGTGQSYMPGATWEFDDESLKNIKEVARSAAAKNRSISEIPEDHPSNIQIESDEIPVNKLAGMSIDDASPNFRPDAGNSSPVDNGMEQVNEIDFSKHLEAAGIKTEGADSNIR